MLALALAVVSAATTARADEPRATAPPTAPLPAQQALESPTKGPGLLRVHCEQAYSLRPGRVPIELTAPDAARASLAMARAQLPATEGPHLLLALPLDYREQVPVAFELKTRPPGLVLASALVEDRPGNWVAKVDLAPLKRDDHIVLEWTAVVLTGRRSFRDFPAHALFPRQWPEEAKPWLASTRCVQADDPRVRAVAASVRDTSSDVVDVITRTFAWMSKRPLDRAPCDVFDAVAGLDHLGSCLSNANTAAGLLRANGIPTRVLGGYCSWANGPISCHFIVESWVPDYGWFPMEPTLCHGPVLPSDQVEVAIVPAAYEDERAIQRLHGARGLPWLSVGECTNDTADFLYGSPLDPPHQQGTTVDQLVRFPRTTTPDDWAQAFASARSSWHGWLTSGAKCDSAGTLRTPVSPADLASVTTPAELAARLAPR